uniref:Uncharacterized protein n=1 Tax=Candidatus Kentrum sp. LFY TaxID=2126342 RepID=A0A450U501_9GAMM|nr:MAG: hypothetical protein BECKLFY1418B_GA0070995_100194 [Candidatus Kentron sp. LFY]
MQGNVGPYAKFPEEEISYILSSVLRVGAALRKKSEREKENPITIRLCKRLKRIERFRDGPLECHLQQEIPSFDPDDDSIIGRMDISVSGVGGGSETYFAIEAKRLRFLYPGGTFETGSPEYVGEKGMMRFVTGKYAPFMQAGAMLGYVFDGNTEKVWSGIGKYIRRKTEMLQMDDPRKLVPSGILPGERVGETRHHRMKDRIFILYHVFISVSPDVSPWNIPNPKPID